MLVSRADHAAATYLYHFSQFLVFVQINQGEEIRLKLCRLSASCFLGKVNNSKLYRGDKNYIAYLHNNMCFNT